MICAIGLGDALVGVSHECNWPPTVARLPRLTRSRVESAADSATIDAQVKSLLAAGKGLYELDTKLLASLRPTLVVAQAQCDVCALSSYAVETALRDSPALSAATLLTLNAHSLEEVLLDIERIGLAANAECAARRFTSSLRQRMAAVGHGSSTRETGRRRPRVVVIEWLDPLMVAGHWTPELVALAGGDYGLALAGEPSRYVCWQQICEWAPELIVVAPCGFDLARTRRHAAVLERLLGWESLPAVASGRVLLADGDALFSRGGPRLVDALEMLSRWISNGPAAPPDARHGLCEKQPDFYFWESFAGCIA
jgi:iron complex transport system substrate-binding protein